MTFIHYLIIFQLLISLLAFKFYKKVIENNILFTAYSSFQTFVLIYILIHAAKKGFIVGIK